MNDAELVKQEAQRRLRFAAEDLDAARQLCWRNARLPRVTSTGTRSRPVQADLAGLTGWGVQARYPGEWPEPSAADAVRAVHNVVAAGFRRRGLYVDVK